MSQCCKSPQFSKNILPSTLKGTELNVCCPESLHVNRRILTIMCKRECAFSVCSLEFVKITIIQLRGSVIDTTSLGWWLRLQHPRGGSQGSPTLTYLSWARGQCHEGPGTQFWLMRIHGPSETLLDTTQGVIMSGGFVSGFIFISSPFHIT